MEDADCGRLHIIGELDFCRFNMLKDIMLTMTGAGLHIIERSV